MLKERNIPKWYDDAQELIDDPEVNAVYIATPPLHTPPYAIMSMKAETGLYRKANGTDLRRVCPHQPHLTRDGSPLFCSLLPALPALLYESEGTGGQGTIGNVINVQIRFAQPPRDLDYNRENLPWRVQADIAGGGYFYDLAPHQIDLLQENVRLHTRSQWL